WGGEPIIATGSRPAGPSPRACPTCSRQRGAGGSETMKRALVALLVFACAGCVATRGSISGPVKPWPPDRPQRQPSISLVIEGTVEGEGVLGAAFAKWRDETLRAYRESGYFAEVVAGLQKKDLRGEIEIHSRIDPAYTNAFLTGFTFFL